MQIYDVSHPGRHGCETIEAANPAAAVREFRVRFGKVQSNHLYTVTDETGAVVMVSSEKAYEAEQIEKAAALKAKREKAEAAEVERVAKVAEDERVKAETAAKEAAAKIEKTKAERKAAAEKKPKPEDKPPT